jgi:hypothetical protein
MSPYRRNHRCSDVSRANDTVPILRLVVALPGRWVLSLIAPGLLWACLGGDECTNGETQCEGNIARNCVVTESHANWQREDCGSRSCVVATSGTGMTTAFCALAPNPDSRCSEAEVPNCTGDTLVECTAGYATSTHSCTSGCLALDDYPDRCTGDIDIYSDATRCVASGDFCEMDGGGSTIATGSITPPPSGTCEPNTLLSSSQGHVTYSQRCEGTALVARTRCAQGCRVNADCSTTCQ